MESCIYEAKHFSNKKTNFNAVKESHSKRRYGLDVKTMVNYDYVNFPDAEEATIGFKNTLLVIDTEMRSKR
uniref:Uncharacterized protein n=1 Tax=Sphaerodactylus townsendi TaxID=933632 RepID=A0ACB8GD69_9SAUR